MSGIQVLVGLANPGNDYSRTRHNAGGWFIETLAQQLNLNLRRESKFHGHYASAKIDHHHFHLLIPSTYMNHSGQAVKACLDYLKLTPESTLIIHDDLDLPVGAVKLKYDGGDGGHNGLKDIIAHLHTKQFYRMRLGIGRPVKNDVIDYVLEPPSKAQKIEIDSAITQGLAILPHLFQGQIQKAMQELHTENKNGS